MTFHLHWPILVSMSVETMSDRIYRFISNTHKKEKDVHLFYKDFNTFTAPHPPNTRCWPDVVLLLARRLRRRPNNKPTLAQHLVFAGQVLSVLGLESVSDLSGPSHKRDESTICGLRKPADALYSARDDTINLAHAPFWSSQLWFTTGRRWAGIEPTQIRWAILLAGTSVVFVYIMNGSTPVEFSLQGRRNKCGWCDWSRTNI